MILASVDCSWAQYDGNRDGTQFPSRQRKLHRPSAADPGLAACSSRVVLNDDADDYPLPTNVCRRCMRHG